MLSNCKPFVLFRLALAEDEVRTLRSKAGLLTDYDTQVRRLRDDIALLTARRDSLQNAQTFFLKDEKINFDYGKMLLLIAKLSVRN
jgi:hypothetical protein